MKTIGKTMIGYRYGKAPESGYSWNYRENTNECGVSMAKVGHMNELGSFAVMNLRDNKVKKYYYIGVIAGEGGDSNEICLTNLKAITYREYCSLLKDEEIINTSNSIVDYLADGKISLINSGWNLGTTIDKLENWRNSNKK